jgi:hypothetical protein
MNRQASNAQTLSVPTPEMYDGDFSNWVDANGRRIVVYDPATTRPNPNGTGFIRDPFPGNIIPASRFSTVARQYLALAGAWSCRIAKASFPARWATSTTTSCRRAARRRRDQQVQRQDRSHAERSAPPVVPVQPHDEPGAAGRHRTGRATRTVQHLPDHELQR